MKRGSFARYGFPGSLLESFIPVVFILQEVAETFVLERTGEVEEVFVATAGKRRNDNGIFRHRRRYLLHVREGVGRLQSRDDALHAGEVVGCGDSFGIKRVDKFHPLLFIQLRKLGAEARIIEPRRYRVRWRYLPVFRLEEERFVSLENTKFACYLARRVFTDLLASAACLDTDELHCFVGNEVIETTYCIASAADARDDCVGKFILALLQLRAYLATDDRLEVAVHFRIRLWPENRADAVVCLVEGVHPEFKPPVHRIPPRFSSLFHRHHPPAEPLHEKDVGPLTADILAPHKDDALESEPGGDRRGGDAVLARARLCDKHLFAEALGEEPLPQAVGYLVRARVVRPLVLEVYLRASEVFRRAFGIDKRRRAARIIFQ